MVHGEEVVAAGTAKEIMRNKKSVTGIPQWTHADSGTGCAKNRKGWLESNWGSLKANLKNY